MNLRGAMKKDKAHTTLASLTGAAGRTAFVFLAILASSFAAHGQGFRWEAQVSQAVTINGVPQQLLSIPIGAAISVCSFPANAVPCTNKATTYSSVTLGTACP